MSYGICDDFLPNLSIEISIFTLMFILQVRCVNRDTVKDKTSMSAEPSDQNPLSVTIRVL